MTRSNLMRTTLGGLLVLGMAALPTAASAQTLAQTKGTLVVGAERLFGLSANKVTTENGNGEVSSSSTDFGLLWGSTSLYMIPRVGVDFVIIDGVTVGAALGFFAGSNSASTVNGVTATETDGPSMTRFLLAPRAGWVHSFGNRLGVWLRGGFTYYRASLTDERTRRNVFVLRALRSSGLSFNAEPSLTVGLAEHVGLTAGVVLDLPLTGSATTEVESGPTTTTVSVDQTARNIGLAVALVGWF